MWLGSVVLSVGKRVDVDGRVLRQSLVDAMGMFGMNGGLGVFDVLR